jgi:hypothetical protein
MPDSARHRHVQDDDIGLAGANLEDCLAGRAGLGDHDEVVLGVEKQPNTRADSWSSTTA